MLGVGNTLAVGDTAPDFTLDNQRGEKVSLADFRGRPVVVYFYPKDETPGCTVEACTFRDRYDEVEQAGAEVIGISADGTESHRRFAEHHRLPFLLLSDPDGAVRKAYGVGGRLALLSNRVTFAIGPDGVIRKVFSSPVDMRAHIREALAALQS